MFARLLEDALLHPHVGLDPTNDLVVGHVGYQLVVLNDIASTESGLVEEVRSHLERITAAGLYHVVEERAPLSFGYAEGPVKAVDAELGTLVPVEEHLWHAQVQELDLAAHADVAEASRQEHRYLSLDVGGGESDLDDVLPLFHVVGNDVLELGCLVDADHLGDVARPDLRGLPGYRRPGPGRLLDRQHRRKSHYVQLFRPCGVVGGDHVCLHIDALRKGIWLGVIRSEHAGFFSYREPADLCLLRRSFFLWRCHLSYSLFLLALIRSI